MSSELQRKRLVFRINDEPGTGPDLVRDVLLRRGWAEHSGERTSGAPHEWNLWWRTSRFRDADYEQIRPWQRLNHYPRSTGITRKDSLARLLRLLAGAYGGAYHFAPASYVLPHDYRRFVSDHSAAAAAAGDRQPAPQFWIYKPADLSRGRGIALFRDPSELSRCCDTSRGVVQRYVANPLLISGHKFDLRLYVAVRSYRPLVIYVYEDGLARFGTEKYNLSETGNVYSHLTNSSINRSSPAYADDKAGIGPGCKWTVKQLRHYFVHRRVDDSALWRRIVAMLVLTVAPLAAESANAAVDERCRLPVGGGSGTGGGSGSGSGCACVELFGFDVLVDEALRPWLLEVNFSPALTTDCALDVELKSALISDLIDLMAFDENEDSLCGGGGIGAERLQRGRRTASARPARATLPQQSHGLSLGRPPGDATAAAEEKATVRASRTASACAASGAYVSTAASGGGGGKALNERADSEPSGDDEDDENAAAANTASLRKSSAATSRSGRLRKRKSTHSAAGGASGRAASLSTLRVASHTRTGSEDRAVQRLSKSALSMPPPPDRRESQADSCSTALGARQPLLERRNNGLHRSEAGGRLQTQSSVRNIREKFDAPRRVGGFVRIYPFNEITAKSQLSLRNIVAETSKLLRRQTECTNVETKEAVSGRHRSRSRYDVDNPFPEIRRPRTNSSYWYID